MRAFEISEDATGKPVVTFNKLAEIFKKQHRIDLYDVYRAGNHFDKWHRSKGYPIRDEQGKHKNSSQIWFKEYQRDPEGVISSPAFFNFWHFCIDWSKNNGDATLMPIDTGTIPPPKRFSEREKAEIHRRLELQTGRRDLPPEYYTAVADMIRMKETKHEGAEKIINLILRDFHGPIVLDLQLDRLR